jgi:hypothetical protein
MPLFGLPLTQSLTIGVTSTTTNDPLCNWVDDTLNDVVATELQEGVVVPVMVLGLHSGAVGGPADWQTVMVPGLPPASTNRVRLALWMFAGVRPAGKLLKLKRTKESRLWSTP